MYEERLQFELFGVGGNNLNFIQNTTISKVRTKAKFCDSV